MLKPQHRRWMLVAVIYDTSRILHLDAVRDAIVAAFIAKAIDKKVKINKKGGE